MPPALLAMGLLCALLLPLGPASAARAGETISGRISLGAKSIPLPAGEWRVARTGFGTARGPDGAPVGVTAAALLTRPDPASDRVFLLIHTNALPVRGGWGTAPSCEGTLFTEVAETRDLHEACSFVSFARGPLRLASILPAMPSESAADLPQWAIVAGFRVSDRRDMIDMRLGVMPPSPNPAGWAAGAGALDAEHEAALRPLVDWAQASRRTVMGAMRAPVTPDATLPMPMLTTTGPVEVHSEEASAMTRSLYRLAGYRVANTALGFVLATYVTGSAVTGGWVQLWNVLTHSALFMANELAWETPHASPIITLSGPVIDAPAAEPGPQPQALPDRVMPVLYGKQIPLTPGAWTELAREENKKTAAVIHGRIEDGALRGLVIARTNTEPTTNIIGPPGECSRTDLPTVMAEFDTPRDGYCAYARTITLSEGSAADPLWAAARVRLAAEGVTLPPRMHEAVSRARTRENFLDLRYYTKRLTP